MKKLSFLMAIIVSLSMIFTACDNQTKPGGGMEIDLENAEAINKLTIYYEGCISPYFPNFAQFTYEAYTGTVSYDPETKALEGSGLVIQLLQVVSYEENYFPVAKKYSPFEIENDQVAEIFDGGAVGVQIIEIENGQQTGNNMATQVFKAEYTGNADNMVWAIEADFEGEKRTFKFEGEPTVFAGGAFSKDGVESTNKYNGEETYAKAEVIYYGDINLLPVNIIEVVLLGQDNTCFANLICYGSLDDIKNVYGTYTVDVKHEVGKMAKSAGVNKKEGYVFPSFVVRNYSQNEGDYYLVDGGTLIIEDGKISFDLVSENGSTFKTTYTGKISIKSYDEAYNAPQAKAPAFKSAINVAKNQPLNYKAIKLF